MAFTSAGAAGGTPVSPMPPHPARYVLPLGRGCTSTRGDSFMRMNG